MKDNRLAVSEVFYSLQGEGSTMGVPAVFLRLKGCNMVCGMQSQYEAEELGGHLLNGATWRCDTIEVWMKGERMDHRDVLNGQIDRLRAGAHLVITGGEPLMQQEQLAQYIIWFEYTFGFVPFIEVETNGTIKPDMMHFGSWVNQWNVSPKLSNSGVKERIRLKTPILSWLNDASRWNIMAAAGEPSSAKVIFKFVITREEDWDEIEDVYLSTFVISKKNIWLMPGADNIDQLLERNQLVANLALKHQVNFCIRLQIEIWNKTVGV